MEVCAWSYEDMPRINTGVVTYHLNMCPSYKLVHQKKRVFALERDNAIKG